MYPPARRATPAAICRSWPVSQSMNRLSAFSVPWGLNSRDANGTSTSAQLMRTKTITATTAIAVAVLVLIRWCSAVIGGAGCPDRRAGEAGEPVPRLMQDSLAPYGEFRRRPVLWRGMGPPSGDVQVAGRQQRADGQQRYAQGQVEAAADVVLGLDRIDVQHEH